MAKLTGPASLFAGDTSVIDTSPEHTLGIRAHDADGNEYVYMKGVASTAQYDWVTFDEAYATARLVADAVGFVAIAQAAIVANSYGWYLVRGSGSGAATATTDNAGVYIDSNAGKVDDTGAAGDAVHGAIARSTVTSGLATFQISYPYVSNSNYLT